MHCFSKMEPFWEPMGTQKSHKSAKVLPKIALFTPSEKRLTNHRFLNPPEPSELSWRLHKTSILTCWPCPQNGIETTSQNLHFRYPWTPKSQKVTKRSVPENALKNTCKKNRQSTKMTSQNGEFLARKLPFLLSVSKPGVRNAQDHQNTQFFIKNVQF